MSTLVRGFMAASRDVRDRWVQLFVGASAIALALALPLWFWFPEPDVWAEWHSVEATYDPDHHAVVITSRSWTLHKPCPEGISMTREARIVAADRMLYVFQTAPMAAVQNERGSHSAGPLIIPLVDIHGKPLSIEPYSVRLAVTCGTRPPVMSGEIVLAPVVDSWWP